MLLVVPTDADVEQMTTDARFFLTSLQGLSEHDVRAGAALPVAGSGSVSRPDASPRSGVRAGARAVRPRDRHRPARHRVRSRTGATAERPRPVRGRRPDARARVRGLPADLGERLAIAGFAPEDPVDEHGEFCVRGGVVDFYPASEPQPVRLEFIGDIIESIRRFDGATQRSLVAVERVTISPLRELLPDERRPRGSHERSTDPRRSWTTRVALASSSWRIELEDIQERAVALEEQWRASADRRRGRGGR